MALSLHHYSREFATSRLDFRVSNSQANSYCINNHFYYVPHEHGDYFDWIYVAEGQLHETINGKDYTLGPGDLVWIREGDWHEEMGHGMKFFVLCGSTYWLESLMGFMQTMEAYRAFNAMDQFPRCNIPPQYREAMTSRWERCWEVYLGALGATHTIRLASELFVDYFLPQIENLMPRRSFPDWFRKAMNYIQNHVGEEISSELLADICDKSPEHVARRFQTYLGSTPSQYINRTRLNYASRLLVATDKSVLDISLTAGFGSHGHFYRLFKKRFGYSPRAYRVRHRNNATK